MFTFTFNVIREVYRIILRIVRSLYQLLNNVCSLFHALNNLNLPCIFLSTHNFYKCYISWRKSSCGSIYRDLFLAHTKILTFQISMLTFLSMWPYHDFHLYWHDLNKFVVVKNTKLSLHCLITIINGNFHFHFWCLSLTHLGRAKSAESEFKCLSFHLVCGKSRIWRVGN